MQTEELIYKWQELTGAIIGASLPFLFWFIIRKIESRQKHKENLLLLEKAVVSSLNNLLDTEDTLKKFMGKQFKELLDNIKEHDKQGAYSTDTAFFPLISVNVLDENLLGVSSKSGFLDNKLLQVISMSKSFAKTIEDFRGQFNYTIQMNKDMAFGQVNSKPIQNAMYLRNLSVFQEAVQRDMFNNNIKIYLKLITTAYVCISEINKRGISRWRFKFSPSFKYFKTYVEYKEFKNNAFDRVKEYLNPKVDEKLKEFDLMPA